MARTAEQVREAKRLHMARRRAADPEKARAYQREFHHRKGDYNRAKMRAYAKRRFFWNKACKLRSLVGIKADHKDLARLWKKQRGLCALSGRKLDRTAEIDHILPRVRGGSDELANLQWTTKEANRAKRDLTNDEFLSLCSDCMRWIGERIDMVDAL